MKIYEIPGIGNTYNMEISEVRERLSEESKKHKILADNMKKVNMYLLYIEKLIKKMQEVCAEQEVQEMSENMYQHIKVDGYAGTWSAIDIDDYDDCTYIILKPDNGVGITNLLCRLSDDDSLIYIANTHCESVVDAFK